MPSTSVPRRVADVGYTMVIVTELADPARRTDPVMDAIIKITSIVLGRDLRGRGAHTMKTLGLHELSIEQLRSL
ncbi:MAG TPA: hypothetical protein VK754_06395 [Propionibacteriaceae bacterium]|nr:hypothetical protein [Propionibacteriaceae bacterium]